MNAEEIRLEEAREEKAPYLSERQWGMVWGFGDWR